MSSGTTFGHRTFPLGNWWAVPLFVVVTAGGAGANFSLGRVHMAVAAGIGALATLVLLPWRRWPLDVLVANAVLVATYLALGLSNGPILLTVVFAMFLASRSRDPRQAWPWPAVAAAVDLVGLGLRSLSPRWSAGNVVVQGTITVAVLAAALAFGAMSRSRGEAHQERARRTASEERLRMAQDLHDGVGHGLAVIAMQAGVALHVLEREPDRARESLQAIRDTSRESLEALRAELSRLAPGSGEPAARRPHNGLDDLPGLVGRVRAGGLTVRLDQVHGPVPDAVGTAAYLVVQESLTNVLRHSGASAAEVTVCQDDAGGLLVTVGDNGQGGQVHEGMGIRGMRARVQALGGSIAIGPSSRGFTVRARFPLSEPC
jgi:signal transduction histidine kinase